MATSPTSSITVPLALVRDILAGRCVAFVGAGFSAPAVPPWKELLGLLAAKLGPDGADLEAGIQRAAGAFDFEALGQILRERFGSAGAFEMAIEEVVSTNFDASKLGDRTRLLLEIPFDAILTTNYDPAFAGVAPSAGTYRRILRRPRRWWERDRWSRLDGSAGGWAEIVKLHGDANGLPDDNPIVIGRGDYRRLVHQSPHYAPFLRAVLATRTVLFLGVSFTDAYLNELRSEVVAMLSDELRGGSLGRWCGEPIAYATLADRDHAWKTYFMDHEGIEVLDFPSQRPGEPPFRGFDEWLEAIHRETAPAARLRHLLAGKQLVWVDDQPGNNDYGMDLLRGAGCEIVRVAGAQELQARHLQADLLLTKFGHRAEDSAVAFDVLAWLGRANTRPPAIVFASGHEAERNRREVLRRGAFEYASGWGELFGVIEQLFGRAVGGHVFG